MYFKLYFLAYWWHKSCHRKSSYLCKGKWYIIHVSLGLQFHLLSDVLKKQNIFNFILHSQTAPTYLVPIPVLGPIFLPGGHGYFHWRITFESKIWMLRYVHCYSGIIVSRPFQLTKQGDICMYKNTCTHNSPPTH